MSFFRCLKMNNLFFTYVLTVKDSRSKLEKISGGVNEGSMTPRLSYVKELVAREGWSIAGLQEKQLAKMLKSKRDHTGLSIRSAMPGLQHVSSSRHEGRRAFLEDRPSRLVDTYCRGAGTEGSSSNHNKRTPRKRAPSAPPRQVKRGETAHFRCRILNRPAAYLIHMCCSFRNLFTETIQGTRSCRFHALSCHATQFLGL